MKRIVVVLFSALIFFSSVSFAKANDMRDLIAGVIMGSVITHSGANSRTIIVLPMENYMPARTIIMFPNRHEGIIMPNFRYYYVPKGKTIMTTTFFIFGNRRSSHRVLWRRCR
ncbi:MAG TPA: hypothetical protein ENJ75_01315 [Candidatus Kaiserbacteria bacterium]|nr:hypothetical protein [Candidatus Kaiserbacteria bacterium]